MHHKPPKAVLQPTASSCSSGSSFDGSIRGERRPFGPLNEPLEVNNRVRTNKSIIRRDYYDGHVVRFNTSLPDRLLEKGLNEETWARTLERIHRIFDEAEDYGWTTCFETFATLLTFNLVSYIWKTHYEKGVAKLERYIDEQNRTVYNPLGLHILSPACKGFRQFDVLIEPNEPVVILGIQPYSEDVH